MKDKRMWAIFIALTIVVSIVMLSNPVTACFTQITSCEGESVTQGDGGATDYWYDDLYPPEHLIDKGQSTEWIINVRGGGGCSAWEHCTVTDNTPPADWSTTIKMGTIYSGSFTYIVGGGSVNPGDYIENMEFYIGSSWNFDIIYNITSPATAPGGSRADMICTVNVVGYNPENQHDYVYVHCSAHIQGTKPPVITITSPVWSQTLTGTEDITWNAFTTFPTPSWEFEIYLSDDLGVSYPYTLVTGYVDTAPFSWPWDTTLWPDNNKYRLKIIGFDGSEIGYAYSDNFTLENHAPDPPSNLVIHFGLPSNAEPTTKAPEDDTGSDLERLAVDDSRGYMVPKGKIMSLETFNTTIQENPITSAILFVEYFVNTSGYSGTGSILWKLETDSIWSDTGIQPLEPDVCVTIQTYDLYAQGVDTIEEITDLDIYFENNDGGIPQGVVFDCLWIAFEASPVDLGLTWTHSTSSDVDHYNIYKSTDNGLTFNPVGVTTYNLWKDPGTAWDLNNYFYRVHGVDYLGKEGLPTYVVGKFVSSISSDWNLASTPLIQQASTSRSKVLTSIDGNYNNVWSYQAGETRLWPHWHDSKPGSFNSLTDIENEYCYYINGETSDDLITIGRLPESPTISLKAGWNLIGYPDLSSQERDTVLSSILIYLTDVYGYDPVEQREEELQSTDLMEPGNGYWIYVTEDCDLIL
jgi:hypothetical protein